MNVAAVILAAGMSGRMGSMKQLLPYNGETILTWTVEQVLRSGVMQAVTVLGYRAEELVPKLDERVRVVINSEYRSGMSSSLQAGISAIQPDMAAVLVVLADQPGVDSRVMDQLIQVYGETGALAVVPTYLGRRGNPVLLDRALFPEVLRLEGDVGARELLCRHRERVCLLPVDSPAVCQDIDTPEEYKAFLDRI